MSKNKVYGYLTSLVEEHRKPTNFCEGLKYRKNFFRVEAFLNTLSDLSDDDIEVNSCFDYESEDDFVKSFRFISIFNHNQLIDIILNNETMFESNISIEYDDNLIVIKFL